ncbi:uncharacterized protein N7483_000771 [Penicillium malachiteum]|uniref:uncharacterized protein n=1 Tax=Penicillium malachiteum TaxID=1324776 RepID=UPI0025498367|nr:uncharacterized protein N7483_000771 [Penicillium malachiteum]KAJ5735646.1 hypothetical protein N7483_000771 [Penicillium malachiteum]
MCSVCGELILYKNNFPVLFIFVNVTVVEEVSWGAILFYMEEPITPAIRVVFVDYDDVLVIIGGGQYDSLQ